MFFKDLINGSGWMKANVVMIWQLMDSGIAFHPLWFASCLCSPQTFYQQAIKVQLKWSVLVRLKMEHFELTSKHLWCQAFLCTYWNTVLHSCVLMRESVRTQNWRYWAVCMYLIWAKRHIQYIMYILRYAVHRELIRHIDVLRRVSYVADCGWVERELIWRDLRSDQGISPTSCSYKSCL